MARPVGAWPLSYEQSLSGIERSRNVDRRILAVRSARYYMGAVGNDAQLSRNLRILEALSTLLYRYRKRFDTTVAQGGSERALAAELAANPVIVEIGSVLRHVLARPEPDIGCFDHPLVWCMDFLDLHQCNFPHARLEQASFYHANLSQADLTYANLGGVDLTDADLSSADCTHAVFAGARLPGANMAWANLSDTDMRGIFGNHINLSGATLDHAVLAGAFLSEANMMKASLIGADLHDANLFAAQLHEAKLDGAILAGTGITVERIQSIAEKVQSNAATRWGNENDCDGRNPLYHGYY